MSRDAQPSQSERRWIKTVVAECKPHEIEECMGDLLDRAEFAEDMARRQVVERLVAALDRTPFVNVTEETRAILAEVSELRGRR